MTTYTVIAGKKDAVLMIEDGNGKQYTFCRPIAVINKVMSMLEDEGYAVKERDQQIGVEGLQWIKNL